MYTCAIYFVCIYHAMSFKNQPRFSNSVKYCVSYSGQETVLNIFDPVSAPATDVCSHRTAILNAFFFSIFPSANQT